MNQQNQQAIEILQNGGVIIYPTDTVLGIGCQALSASAIKKIYRIKKRNTNIAMLVLVNSLKMIKLYKENVSDLEAKLLLSEEPTTVVLDNVKGFPPELMGNSSSLAFRITKHKGCLELIKALNQPLVSTSANFSGERTATSHENIPVELRKKVDFVIEENQTIKITKASRIVKVSNDTITYLRK
jgi:L-threonylcarbamoyladenylate synthase